MAKQPQKIETLYKGQDFMKDGEYFHIDEIIPAKKQVEVISYCAAIIGVTLPFGSMVYPVMLEDHY